MNTEFLMVLSSKIEIAPLLLHLVICSEISHPCLLDDFYPVRIHWLGEPEKWRGGLWQQKEI